MSYGLSFEETRAESVQRIRREQLEAAAEGLERGHDEDPVEAVHDARKRIKKTRSLLRLARPGLRPKTYRRRNRALRDTGRGLSGARDADVLAETVDGLAERFVGQLPEGFFTTARAPLAARAEAERKATYHERLLHDSWPNVMKAQAKEAKKLSKLLGEDHDLAVLAEHVDDPQLLALIEQRRAELLERSRDLGRRIYAERPKAFARRARRYVDLAAA